jgi:hypothetical protein
VKKTELVGMGIVQDMIELTLWTAYVRHEKIVSLLILAEPETGRTELLKKYRNNHGVIVKRRFSSYGILSELIEGKRKLLFEKPKILGHILVYDMSGLFTFKPSTIDSTIEFLDALMEEGLSSEATYALGEDELRAFNGLRGGLIAAINTFGFFTSEKTRKVRAYLYKGGFFSRAPLISFSESELQVQKIFESIQKGYYREDKSFVNTINLNFPEKRISVYISDVLSKEIIDIARDVASEYTEDLKNFTVKGIRLSKALITLAKASALRDGRRRVERVDVERIRFLSKWMNLKMNRLKRKYVGEVVVND